MPKLPDLSIGFSPCPNDTFIFNALVNGSVKTPGFKLKKEILADVETLNQWAIAGELDITKLSFHALAHVLDDYVLLRAGSALGRGCGPLLLRHGSGTTTIVCDGNESPKNAAGYLSPDAKVAIPGKYTTAALLFQMAYPECRNLVILPFEKIMTAIVNREVDAGVVIHESRFTYQDYGLTAVLDLGDWWEKKTACPIPLGGIVAKRKLGKALLNSIEAAIVESLAQANANDICGAYIKDHAQEMDEEVIRSHIGLYVNDYSRDLGEDGTAAVREFLRRGNEAGVFNCQPENILIDDDE
jgi:1,4-dihydroxy-6-naphthoate synthase